MIAVVKFFANPDPTAAEKDPLISRTLGKIALLDKAWVNDPHRDLSAPQPADGEFWRVDITHETKQGTDQGVVLVAPISKVAIDDLVYLPIESASQLSHNGLVVLRLPKERQHQNYILPLKLRDHMLRVGGASLIVIDHGGKMWTPRDSEWDYD